jgi:hypothetical protein
MYVPEFFLIVYVVSRDQIENFMIKEILDDEEMLFFKDTRSSVRSNYLKKNEAAARAVKNSLNTRWS